MRRFNVDFGLLVGQKKTTEGITFNFGKLELVLFWHIIGQAIQREKNKQYNNIIIKK